MEKRGFYLKRSKNDELIELFINIKQFKNFLDTNVSDDWAKFEIYKNNRESKFEFNMKLKNNRNGHE